MATQIADVEKGSIRVPGKNHVAGTKCDTIIGVGGYLIQQLINDVAAVVGGGCLLLTKFTVFVRWLRVYLAEVVGCGLAT